MKNEKCVCPKCGCDLVIEYIGNYGTIYRINKNGTIGRREKRMLYELNGDYMVYCKSCGECYDGRLRAGKFELFYEQEEKK